MAVLPPRTSMQATDGSESIRSALTGYSETFSLAAADGNDLILAAAVTPVASGMGEPFFPLTWCLTTDQRVGPLSCFDDILLRDAWTALVQHPTGKCGILH